MRSLSGWKNCAGKSKRHNRQAAHGCSTLPLLVRRMALSTMKLDPKTQARLRSKIERAYQNVERLPETSHRRTYWWRVAQKLQEKLRGGPLRIAMMPIDQPTEDFKKTFEALQAQLAKELHIPRRHLMGFDLASGPDRSLLAHYLEGRFVLATELTTNSPFNESPSNT